MGSSFVSDRRWLLLSAVSGATRGGQVRVPDLTVGPIGGSPGNPRNAMGLVDILLVLRGYHLQSAHRDQSKAHPGAPFEELVQVRLVVQLGADGCLCSHGGHPHARKGPLGALGQPPRHAQLISCACHRRPPPACCHRGPLWSHPMAETSPNGGGAAST